MSRILRVIRSAIILCILQQVEIILAPNLSITKIFHSLSFLTDLKTSLIISYKMA
jgi:hypothetical protein